MNTQKRKDREGEDELAKEQPPSKKRKLEYLSEKTRLENMLKCECCKTEVTKDDHVCVKCFNYVCDMCVSVCSYGVACSEVGGYDARIWCVDCIGDAKDTSMCGLCRELVECNEEEDYLQSLSINRRNWYINFRKKYA